MEEQGMEEQGTEEQGMEGQGTEGEVEERRRHNDESLFKVGDECVSISLVLFPRGCCGLGLTPDSSSGHEGKRGHGGGRGNGGVVLLKN